MKTQNTDVITDAWATSKPTKAEPRYRHHDDTVTEKTTSIWKALGELASQSNLHGVSCIASDKPKILRFFWILAFLALSTFAVYQLYTLGVLFYSYPVKTKVEVELKPLTFPAVTICNMNIIRLSKINDIPSSSLQKLLKGTLTDTLDLLNNVVTDLKNLNLPNLFGNTPSPTRDSTSSSSSILDLLETDSLFGDLLESGYNQDYLLFEKFLEEYIRIPREDKKKVGHQLQNMLLDCHFNGRNCDVTVKDVVTYDYGNCYTIQSPQFVGKSTGPISGMVLTINLENHEAIVGLTEGFGLRIVIHEQNSLPLPSDLGFTVSAGYETSVGLRMTRIERQGDPYGKCTDVNHYLKEHGVHYSRQACLQHCLENVTLSLCGCRIGYLLTEMDYFSGNGDTLNETIQGCFGLEDRKCSLEVRINLLDDVDSFCDCPQSCVENSYTTTISGRLWPHDTKLAQLTHKACVTYDSYNLTGTCDLQSLSNLANNFLKVNIYYEDLSYEKITEEPSYNYIQVISDVGGSLGLCLGASLLCVFELFEAFITVLIVLCRKCRRQNNSVSEINLHRTSFDEFKSSKT